MQSGLQFPNGSKLVSFIDVLLLELSKECILLGSQCYLERGHDCNTRPLDHDKVGVVSHTTGNTHLVHDNSADPPPSWGAWGPNRVLKA